MPNFKLAVKNLLKMFPGGYLFIFMLCQSAVLTNNQETDGIITASSHKSFYGLETLVENKAKEHSRSKRSVVFTQDEIDTLITLHQDYRRDVSPKAANMEYMTWDEDLASMAVEYSEKCIWGHGTVPNTSPYESIGQNLWIRGGTTQQPDAGAGVTAWHNEVDDYDYDQNSCKPGKQCGHYTQVVWSSSVAVGCGLAFCETTENWNTQNSWLLTCHYGPAGNYVGVKPYISGSSCTQCDSNIGQCFDNMCRLCSDHNGPCDCQQECDNCGTVNTDTCSCECPNGFYGPKCENECVDWHENCYKSPGWPGPQFCDRHEAVPRGCPKMCGLCVDPDPDFVCAYDLIETTTYTEAHTLTSTVTEAQLLKTTTTTTFLTEVQQFNGTVTSFTEEQYLDDTETFTEGQHTTEDLMCSDLDCESGAMMLNSAIGKHILLVVTVHLLIMRLL